ncbi:hypothetical protein SZN_22181 [Streptomyces zinciresistens K42]|uniref:Uncharacterized protein n=1 Tax=Streptomyces zinciresistens K42 TaxID=700597 RepID=G2GG02_9ACTN|nr:hypothetical protein [Streptomyces zinciresistens]EGX57581.1 hypothetical protein SZN_22181 [Streptomyces zinciresistens K42]
MTDYLPQVATVPFPMPRPEDLPDDAPAIAAAAPSVLALPAGEVARPASRTGVAELLAAARTARTELGRVSSTLVGDDPGESRPNRDNDLAFGIERHLGDPLALFVQAALNAHIGILEIAEERGTGLDQASWCDLVKGFDTLLLWLAEPTRLPAPLPVPGCAGSGRPEPLDGLRRWVRGHHVFMVLSQGGTLALNSLAAAADTRDEEGAATAAGVASRVMWACRAALAFAGDASPGQYQAEIRPTLMPPVAPPQMSGLRWRDHEALVVALTESRGAWSWLAERRPGALEDFRTALDATYEAHKGVCGHFVGSQSPSLLATSRSHRPAVGVIEQFHRLRAGTLPAPPGAGPHR